MKANYSTMAFLKIESSKQKSVKKKVLKAAVKA